MNESILHIISQILFYWKKNLIIFCSQLKLVSTCELPGFRGCAPRRRGSGQANKAERIGTACRGDSWSDLAWKRGEGFPLLPIKNRRYNNANRQ